jgi:hypothetical protein
VRDVYLQVEAAMTPEEREAFLRWLNKLNPRAHGAHVADYLAMLHDADAALDFVEPTYDAVYEALVEEGTADDAPLIGPCALAVYYCSQGKPTVKDVLALVRRAAGEGD